MNKGTLNKIAREAEAENAMFARKEALEVLSPPSKIVGRDDKAKELVRYILGYRHGLAVPFVSICGRSGCGKSAVARFVCKNLEGIQHAFVDLRKARTVFGCANLILSELGMPNAKSAHGMSSALAQITRAIAERLEESQDRMFVLALDEFDAIFSDSRGGPSDFVYRLMGVAEEIRDGGLYMCVVGISNMASSEYDLDNRVKSRIGSSEIFFDPYSEREILGILEERAKTAFSKKPGAGVLRYCAKLSSGEHGDARRAIDLLRVGSEIADSRSEALGTSHIDAASEKLQQDTVSQMLARSSHHQKVVCAALARVSYLSGRQWHATSALHGQYKKILGDDAKPLSYRRVSDLLSELTEIGLAVSETGSRGRHGYGTQYKLLHDPGLVGAACFGDWWESVVDAKKRHESQDSGMFGHLPRGRFARSLHEALKRTGKQEWDDFVGT